MKHLELAIVGGRASARAVRALREAGGGGTVALVSQGVEEARLLPDELERAGVDCDEVVSTLEREGGDARV